MSRSTIANRRAILLDAATVLRDYAAVAVAATTAENPLTSINAAELQYYKAVVDVAAHTGYAVGSAQWQITVEVSADGVNYFIAGTVIPNGIANRYQLPLSGEWVEKIVTNSAYPDINYTRAKATKVGSPGNLTYGAFLTC